MTTRRRLIISFGLGALGVQMYARAQQSARVPTIGLLGIGAEGPSHFQTLRDGLRELGYVEGRNLRIEDRSHVDNYDGFPKAIEDLLVLRVDLIVTNGSTALLTARKAAPATPIVMISGIDPVASGIAATLARPGGNVTGVSQINISLVAKRLELLREVLPGLKRIATLHNPASATQENTAKETEATAKSLKLQVHRAEARTAQELEGAIAAARKKAEALVVLPSTMLQAYRPQVAAAAAKYRFPAIGPQSEWAEAGLLVSYAPSYTAAFRRAAYYVDRILKGAKPGDLPIEQPTKFELVINRKTARALGIKIPQTVLLQADRVIE